MADAKDSQAAEGTSTAEAPRLTKADFQSDQDPRWCPGCGDYAILATVQKVMPKLGVPREELVFISGIGCSSRFPYYMNTYGFHTIHGRAPTFATGLKLARPELMVWMVTGDGDALSIGGNHLLHILRRNVDVKILLFNNRIYGLTKGQYSPTSEQGKITKSSPSGSADFPVNPSLIALGAEATFVARSVDRNIPHLEKILKRAAAHRGSAFIEIYQNCNVFNDGAFSYLTERATKIETELVVEHGKPLVFGPIDDRRAFRLRGTDPEIVKLGEVPDDELWIYDETDPTAAGVLARLDYPRYPVPIGVFLDIERPTFAHQLVDAEEKAIENKGPGSIEQLFMRGQTWEV